VTVPLPPLSPDRADLAYVTVPPWPFLIVIIFASFFSGLLAYRFFPPLAKTLPFNHLYIFFSFPSPLPLFGFFCR